MHSDKSFFKIIQEKTYRILRCTVWLSDNHRLTARPVTLIILLIIIIIFNRNFFKNILLFLTGVGKDLNVILGRYFFIPNLSYLNHVTTVYTN